jgi:hypothetical protein
MRPNVLVLTKIRRAAQWIGSTRPKSLVKMQFDTSDIEFLMGTMAKDSDTIDFVGYGAADVDRLYSACTEMVRE